MTIINSEQSSRKVAVITTKNSVETSFTKWSKPGHFSKVLSKGPGTTTWIWNLHADAHDFDTHTTDLEDISRKIFSAHFGQLAIIEVWLSGMFFHGARFSNYESWLNDPLNIKPTAQIVWPIFGQEILNADVGGDVSGIQITSGLFQIWRAAGILTTFELYVTAVAGLFVSFLFLFAGWFHYHKSAPNLQWFQNLESMLNHHLAGLLGLGCLAWSGHQIHVSLPINYLLDAGIPAGEIPWPSRFILNKAFMVQLFPSFSEGLLPFFSFKFSNYLDILTFKGGLNRIIIN